MTRYVPPPAAWRTPERQARMLALWGRKSLAQSDIWEDIATRDGPPMPKSSANLRVWATALGLGPRGGPVREKPRTVDEFLAAGGRIKRCPAVVLVPTQAAISAADVVALRAYRAAWGR